MELKEFVSETLVQITEGVVDAAKICEEKGSKVNPICRPVDGMAALHSGNLSDDESTASAVKFHIGLCETADAAKKGGIGVFLSAVGVGMSEQNGQSQSATTSIEFSVPIELPHPSR